MRFSMLTIPTSRPSSTTGTPEMRLTRKSSFRSLIGRSGAQVMTSRTITCSILSS